MYEIRTKNEPGKRIVDIHFELESLNDYKEMYKILKKITLAISDAVEDEEGEEDDKMEIENTERPS